MNSFKILKYISNDINRTNRSFFWNNKKEIDENDGHRTIQKIASDKIYRPKSKGVPELGRRRRSMLPFLLTRTEGSYSTGQYSATINKSAITKKIIPFRLGSIFVPSKSSSSTPSLCIVARYKITYGLIFSSGS